MQQALSTHPDFQNLQFKSELGVLEVIGHLIIWLLLSIVTFGLAMFVFPYYMQRYTIGRTFAFNAQGQRVGQLICTIDLASIIGNVLLWVLISLVTLGLGYFVFLYKISAHCLSHTKLISVTDMP
ncbi:DUF6693 family protein [Orrella sp. 11846]|uniref:DUF6693 family protein n=1 Tax=Orrella sp. 11846 TaxID=3409913 RepID=UPI003B594EA5